MGVEPRTGGHHGVGHCGPGHSSTTVAQNGGHTSATTTTGPTLLVWSGHREGRRPTGLDGAVRGWAVLYAEVEGRGPTPGSVQGFTQTRSVVGPVATDLARHHEVCGWMHPAMGRSGGAGSRHGSKGPAPGETGGAATLLSANSMGARLCLQLALDHPQLVDALVLLGGDGGHRRTPPSAGPRRRDDEPWPAELEQVGWTESSVRWLPGRSSPAWTKRPAGMDARLANTVAGLATSLPAGGTGAQEPLWRRLCELPCRWLAMAGENDGRYPLPAQAMGRPSARNAELAVVPGAGTPPRAKPGGVPGHRASLPGRNGTTPAGS